MGSSYRARSRSYSPPPRRSPPRRRYDEPPPREQPYSDHRSQRDHRSPGPSGLLVRNISLSARNLLIYDDRVGFTEDRVRLTK